MATHYEIVGVSASASAAEVRAAYHDRARRLHPDRQQGASKAAAASSERAMQELNAAWWVLRDPGRRSAYDRRLGGVVTPPPRAPAFDDDDLDRPFPSRTVEPGDLGMSIVRGLPWIAVALILGIIFVFTAFAGGGARDPSARAYDLVGRCISFGADVVVVPCDSPNDGRVDLVATDPGDCPDTSTARNLAGRWLCLRPATSG